MCEQGFDQQTQTKRNNTVPIVQSTNSWVQLSIWPKFSQKLAWEKGNGARLTFAAAGVAFAR